MLCSHVKPKILFQMQKTSHYLQAACRIKVAHVVHLGREWGEHLILLLSLIFFRCQHAAVFWLMPFPPIGMAEEKIVLSKYYCVSLQATCLLFGKLWRGKAYLPLQPLYDITGLFFTVKIKSPAVKSACGLLI